MKTTFQNENVTPGSLVELESQPYMFIGGEFNYGEAVCRLLGQNMETKLVPFNTEVELLTGYGWVVVGEGSK
jgi:hypothetical protein